MRPIPDLTPVYRQYSFHPLRDAQGVYVIDFGDRVKLGCSGDLRHRLLWHWRSGAVSVNCWHMGGPRSGAPVYKAEAIALDRAANVGTRIGKSESFHNLTFDYACAIVRGVLNELGQPINEYVTDLAELEASLVHKWWEIAYPHRADDVRKLARKEDGAQP
jgi:hypothetical protein